MGRLNRVLFGWANYFCLGRASPAYAAIDAHATKRLRQRLCRKHKVEYGGVRALPGREAVAGLRLGTPEGAEAQLRVSEGMVSNESRVREIRTLGSMSGERNVVKVGNHAPARWRKPPTNCDSLYPRQARLSSTLLWAVAAVASRNGPETQGFGVRGTLSGEWQPASASERVNHSGRWQRERECQAGLMGYRWAPSEAPRRRGPDPALPAHLPRDSDRIPSRGTPRSHHPHPRPRARNP